MKRSIQLFGLLLFLATLNVSARDYREILDSKDVKVYYFHATARCVTCKAVEEVTQKTLKDSYGDKVPFVSIDREKEKDNPLIKKYKVAGQTLLVVEGDNVVNLTNDAFLNARTKPKKLSSKLTSTIDKMLK